MSTEVITPKVLKISMTCSLETFLVNRPTCTRVGRGDGGDGRRRFGDAERIRLLREGDDDRDDELLDAERDLDLDREELLRDEPELELLRDEELDREPLSI